MASARLIPRSIYHSRSFLKLPVTAQNLFTFLILNTDNDGIVEAYGVMSMIDASDDDLRILEERGFIYVLDNEWITYIRHFQAFNNFDRRNFQVSKHRQLLIQIHPEIEKELVVPQKRVKNKVIPGDSMESPGEENQKKNKLNNNITLSDQHDYDFAQLETELLSN